MDKKAIVKLLEKALEGKSPEALVEALGISHDEYELLTEGSMEFSPLMAKKFAEVLDLDARAILAAQADDQLNALGVAAKPVEKVEVAAVAKQQRAKGTGTDGRPSQGSISKDRGMVSMTMVGVSDAQANKAVKAVMASFAD